jgi:hypothetical protein
VAADEYEYVSCYLLERGDSPRGATLHVRPTRAVRVIGNSCASAVRAGEDKREGMDVHARSIVD